MNAQANENLSQRSKNPSPAIGHLIKSLREEAAKNDVFEATCLTFATRDRARKQVTVTNLKLTLAANNYTFTRQQVSDVLKFLADLGIGKLILDSKGNIVSLVEIKYTLQTIGLAALGQAEKVHVFKPQQRLMKLPGDNNMSKNEAPVGKAHQTAPKVTGEAPLEPKYPVKFVATIEGKQVEFWPGAKLTPDQIGKLIVKLTNEYQS
jgi:hypothetical protein